MCTGELLGMEGNSRGYSLRLCYEKWLLSYELKYASPALCQCLFTAKPCRRYQRPSLLPGPVLRFEGRHFDMSWLHNETRGGGLRSHGIIKPDESCHGHLICICYLIRLRVAFRGVTSPDRQMLQGRQEGIGLLWVCRIGHCYWIDSMEGHAALGQTLLHSRSFCSNTILSRCLPGSSHHYTPSSCWGTRELESHGQRWLVQPVGIPS